MKEWIGECEQEKGEREREREETLLLFLYLSLSLSLILPSSSSLSLPFGRWDVVVLLCDRRRKSTIGGRKAEHAPRSSDPELQVA